MDYERLRRFADRLAGFAESVEDGWHVEIGGQGIVVAPGSGGVHEAVATRIVLQLNDQLASEGQGVVALAGPHIEDRGLGRLRRPDVSVVPLATLEAATGAIGPQDVRLVAEVVSPSEPVNDYHDKRADYPAMGIPLYLLVDPRRGVLLVHSEPAALPDGQAGYLRSVPYAFGDTVPVGPWLIETGDFPRYPLTGRQRPGSGS